MYLEKWAGMHVCPLEDADFRPMRGNNNNRRPIMDDSSSDSSDEENGIYFLLIHLTLNFCNMLNAQKQSSMLNT